MKTAIIFSLIFIVKLVSAEIEDICNTIYDHSTLYQLKEHLFCDYDPSIRSVTPDKKQTSVKTIIKLIFAEFDDEKGLLTAHTVVTLDWNDPHLTWNPDDFDGLNKTYVKSSAIWVPRMYSLKPRPEEESKSSEATCSLKKNGQIRCRIVHIFVASCDSDFTYWPYDTHSCSIDIGAWPYTRSEVDMHYISGYYTRFYNNHPAWDIDVSTVKRTYRTSTYRFNESFPLMSTEIRLSRPFTVLRKAVVTPLIILTVVNLTVLWLRVGSVQRLILSCASLQGHLLGLMNLNWLLPDTEDVTPNILIFYVNSLILSMLALVVTCSLQKLLHSKREVPTWLEATISTIFNSKVGQILSINILDPEASQILHDDDDDNLMETAPKKMKWDNVVTVISWITFFIFIFVYIVMCVVLLR